MEKTLKDILQDQMQFKGLNPQKVKQRTGISDRHLIGFFEGKAHYLPSAPYIRGYLLKLGEMLELNGNDLWELYKREADIKTSGSNDILPSNRFALKKINKRWVIGGGIALVVGAYLIANADRFLGHPNISIANPSAETLLTTANTIDLVGTINPGDTLTIDADTIVVDEGGNFQKTYTLQPGLNRIEFSVRRFLGRETKVVRQVIYQPQ